MQKKNSLYLYSFGPGHKVKRNGTKVYFGGLIRYGNFCVDYFYANPKTFRHDSARSVKSTTKKGPGYCYVAPSLPNSCFLGHVTGLLFCLNFKILLHQYMRCSILNHFNQKSPEKPVSRMSLVSILNVIKTIK